MSSPKYRVIYADPPWSYRNYAYAATSDGRRARRGIVKEYPTLSVAEVACLPVGSLSAPDSLLFLWATCPLLDQAISVVSAWGFTYYSVAFVWVKTYSKSGKLFWGMGNWTRSNTELVLLGRRGKPTRASASVHQVVELPVSDHSSKPAEIRNRIVKLYDGTPRLELFARDNCVGWDCVGNAINGEDIRVSLARIIAEQDGEL